MEEVPPPSRALTHLTFILFCSMATPITTKLRPLLTHLPSPLLPSSSFTPIPTCTQTHISHLPIPWRHLSHRRAHQTSAPPSLPKQAKRKSKPKPNFAFAFDIDGVLLRSSAPLPGASQALSYLHQEQIPYILLTNGGGKTELARITDISRKLGIDFLDERDIVQSHTPFTELHGLKRKTVLVCGGDRAEVKEVAKSYGFNNVVTPGDLVVACPELWPFNAPLKEYYESFAEKLPKPLYSPTGNPVLDGDRTLKIDAVFVYSDPRDWGLDASIILDLLLSEKGFLGTLSEKNGREELENCGFLQDGQPRVFFSNPDLWWATSYHLSRLGQGGFQAALRGLWERVTEGKASLERQVTVSGKPTQLTYEFAEERLRKHVDVQRVYMIGDNLESDIAGANGYESPCGNEWKSVLVKTGVWREGMEWTESRKPYAIKENVLEAVQWAVEDAKNA